MYIYHESLRIDRDVDRRHHCSRYLVDSVLFRLRASREVRLLRWCICRKLRAFSNPSHGLIKLDMLSYNDRLQSTQVTYVPRYLISRILSDSARRPVAGRLWPSLLVGLRCCSRRSNPKLCEVCREKKTLISFARNSVSGFYRTDYRSG